MNSTPPKTAPIMTPVLEDRTAPPAKVGLGSNVPDTVTVEACGMTGTEAVTVPGSVELLDGVV